MNDANQMVLTFYKSSPGGSLALVDRLLWGPEVDQLLSDERVTSLSSAGTAYWSLPDHLGTVVDVATYNSGTDTTTIAKHRGFDSFGNITSDSATGVIFVIGYTGKYLDSATGLQNNINRWYAASLGEWMSEDPIGFEGGDENLRRYVNNKVETHIDPQGTHDSTTITYSGVMRIKRNIDNLALWLFRGGSRNWLYGRDVDVHEVFWYDLRVTPHCDESIDVEFEVTDRQLQFWYYKRGRADTPPRPTKDGYDSPYWYFSEVDPAYSLEHMGRLRLGNYNTRIIRVADGFDWEIKIPVIWEYKNYPSTWPDSEIQMDPVEESVTFSGTARCVQNGWLFNNHTPQTRLTPFGYDPPIRGVGEHRIQY